jgi:phage host-nuclease inhibitor protein Gam
MARKKESTYSNWEEVNLALRRMGEIDILVNKLQGKMTLKINEIKADYDVKSQGLLAERKEIEKNITLFTDTCKDEFAKTRHKDLTFGKVAYKVTSRIMIKSKEACLAALKALKMTDYIRIKEEPDKEAMVDLDQVTLAKVGATVKVEDKLRIEPNLETLKELV